MVKFESVRKMALSLPEATEKPHWGDPSFRVGDKIFAVLHPKEDSAILKMTPMDYQALIQSGPETFFATSWGHQGWTGVRLAKVKQIFFRDMLFRSWRNVAPKRLVAANNRTK